MLLGSSSVREKAPIYSSEKVQTKVLPICLQIIPMDRRRFEMYGTVGTKFSFVFELYRYKLDKIIENHAFLTKSMEQCLKKLEKSDFFQSREGKDQSFTNSFVSYTVG